jgi:hypothetical protein
MMALVSVFQACAQAQTSTAKATTAEPSTAPSPVVDRGDDAILDDLERRCFQFFWEQAEPTTGLVADRAPADGSEKFDVASIAATGYGLVAVCIADERGWVTHEEAYERVLTTLRFIWEKLPHEHGFYYHFIDNKTGERSWNCELSSVDTALLMGGVMVARQYYKGTEVEELATKIYERVDWPWMRGEHKTVTMGWKPESGFLGATWDGYSEHTIIYLLGLVSPTHPLPDDAWRIWKRVPIISYDEFTFMACPPLFTHQFSHAFIDYRNKRDHIGDYYQNSVLATKAHRRMCVRLGQRFPHYGEKVWGISASDYAGGYIAWGGPPATSDIDGTVVPYAVAGSVAFLPEESIESLAHMKKVYGKDVWKHYGFVDAFNPQTGYIARDVIGIDVGISLMMIENYRSGFVWKHFMANPEVQQAMDKAGFVSTEQQLPEADVEYLRGLAADTWRCIAATADEKTGLPADRLDGDGITSVSNIGIYLASTAAASQMGFIDRDEAEKRIDLCLTTVESLPTTFGFQQSWHNHKTMEPSTEDPWISVLDTGNLVGGLMTVAQAHPRFRERCNKLINAMQWSTFYQAESGRLLGGYNVAEQKTNPDWKVDTLGTDARLAQFLAIATGGAPTKMWDTLKRNVESRYDAHYLWPGWQGGGLFMQYVNGLFLDESGTLMGRSAENFAYAQIRHAQENGYPVWGWSACAGPDGNYLGWGGLIDEVVSPHASVLAIGSFPGEVVENLKKLETMGARPNEMGFVDSVNIEDGTLSDQYLVWDQGMLFLSLTNYLEDDIVRRWVGSHPLARKGYEMISDYKERPYTENNSVYNLEAATPSEMLYASWNKGNRTARVLSLSHGWEHADWHAITVDDCLEKGQLSPDNEASARFAFAWDEKALHVTIRVTDRHAAIAPKADRLFEQDSVELFIDPQDDGLAWGSDKDFQFGFALPGKTWEWFGGRHAQIEQAVTKTGDGYEVRASIPWRVLGVEPGAGRKLQASVAVNSFNAQGESPIKLNWRFKEDASGIRLGELVLE